MSYRLSVYSSDDEQPSPDAVSELLEVAGWQWAPLKGLDTFRRAHALEGCQAVGWDMADDIGDSVMEAVTAANPDLLSAPVQSLSVVEIALEDPLRPDSELISELREMDADPDLVTRVEEAAVCWILTADGRVTEPTVEFIWALASAVGVLTDGVLLDDEDGTLLDCTEDGED